MIDLTKPIVIDTHEQRPGSSPLLWALFFSLHELTQNYRPQELVSAESVDYIKDVAPSFIEKLEAPLDLVPQLNDTNMEWDRYLLPVLVEDIFQTIRLKMTELLGDRHVFQRGWPVLMPRHSVTDLGGLLHPFFKQKREQMCLEELERNAGSRDKGFMSLRAARLTIANEIIQRIETSSETVLQQHQYPLLGYQYVQLLYDINHIDRMVRFLRTIRHRGTRREIMKDIGS